jgi:hypothetical protein
LWQRRSHLAGLLVYPKPAAQPHRAEVGLCQEGHSRTGWLALGSGRENHSHSLPRLYDNDRQLGPAAASISATGSFAAPGGSAGEMPAMVVRGVSAPFDFMPIVTAEEDFRNYLFEGNRHIG